LREERERRIGYLGLVFFVQESNALCSRGKFLCAKGEVFINFFASIHNFFPIVVQEIEIDRWDSNLEHEREIERGKGKEERKRNKVRGCEVDERGRVQEQGRQASHSPDRHRSWRQHRGPHGSNRTRSKRCYDQLEDNN
jgi:hypothetical protein